MYQIPALSANGSAVQDSSSKKRRGGLSKVVDVTIAYPDGKPLNLVSIATGWDPPCTTHVHYREEWLYVLLHCSVLQPSGHISSILIHLNKSTIVMVHTFKGI